MRGVWLDPERREITTLDRMIVLRGKRVIEIGCGDGRLTVELARRSRRLEAIDPDDKAVARGRRLLPKSLKARVRFRVGKGESLPFDEASFDVAVMSWSL
jgi:ubiquinone/menaquinone biosynthesis C-methylase UbiE